MTIIDPNQFTVSSNRGVLVQPALVFEVFLWDTGDGGAIGVFYENVLQQLADRLPFCHKNNRTMPFKGKATSSVPTWLAHPNLNPEFHFELFDEQNGAPAASLTLIVKQRHEAVLPAAQRRQRLENIPAIHRHNPRAVKPRVSSLRLTVPLDHPLAEPATFKHWLLEQPLLQQLPFLSGYAGLGLNVYHWCGSAPAAAEAWRTARMFAMRHCGLDLPATINTNVLRFDDPFFERHHFFLPLFKRASWLNFLGPLQCEALGGRATLSAAGAAVDGLTTTDLPHGLMIQAGAAPALGDLGRRDFLPAYRAVAALVRPLRPEHFDGFGSDFDSDAQAEWLDGLDRDYD